LTTMPQLKWDETEVIACLEVLPSYDDEYDTSVIFEVEQHNLAMTFIV
jgi:hypothetical protein